MIKSFIRKQAIKHLLSAQIKPVNVKDLDFAGVDTKGNRYYTWPELKDLPRARFLQVETTNIWIDNKISPSSLDQLTHAIDEVNQTLLIEKDKDKKIRLHSQISALTSEIRNRSQYAIPNEVLIALASILLVREDETPEKFNSTIHEEKQVQFLHDLNNGNDFFFKFPIFKQLVPSLFMSTESWTQHMMQQGLQKVREEEHLKIILSKTSAKSTSKEKMK